MSKEKQWNGERVKRSRGMVKEQREAEEWRKSKEKQRNGERAKRSRGVEKE